MTDLASLRIAEDRVEWAVREARQSGDVYWDTRDDRDDAESDLRVLRHRYPLRKFSIVSRRLIVTEWSETE